MSRRKKEWIDKKRSITYELVNRPVRDDSEVSVPSALNPIRAYGQEIDDDELYNMLANKVNPDYEKDSQFDYWADDQIDPSSYLSKFTKPIGKPGGVFVTQDGDVVPSNQANDPNMVIIPESEFLRQEEHEMPELDPEIANALENYDTCQLEQLNDDFVVVANEGKVMHKIAAEDLDVGGEYGLDDLEGDDDYHPSMAEMKNTKKSTNNNNNINNNNSAKQQQPVSSKLQVHHYQEEEVQPPIIEKNLSHYNRQFVKTEKAPSKMPSKQQQQPSNDVRPLSEIMKNLHIEKKGNILSNFNYSSEDEDNFEDADEDDEDEDDDLAQIIKMQNPNVKLTKADKGNKAEEDFDTLVDEFDEDSDDEEDDLVPRVTLKEAAFEEAMDEFLEENVYVPLKFEKKVKDTSQEVYVPEAPQKPTDRFGNTSDGSFESDEEDIDYGEEAIDQIMETIEIERASRSQWDCESIITTYSNTENHPALIAAPRRDLKIPLNNRGLPRKDLVMTAKKEIEIEEETEEESEETDSGEDELDELGRKIGEKRSRNETPEEKKARKQLIKEQRRQAREDKKQLKVDFRKETVKQRGQNVSNFKNCTVIVL